MVELEVHYIWRVYYLSHDYLLQASWWEPDKRPRASWPENVAIEFKNYSTRYRPGLDCVLSGLSCSINAAEKVGIITGFT